MDAYIGQWRFDWAAARGTPPELQVSVSTKSPGLSICYQNFDMDKTAANAKTEEWKHRSQAYINAISAGAQEETKKPVVTVRDDAPGYTFRSKWYSVPWEGVLEWVFNYGHSRLFHDGRLISQNFY